MPNPAKAKGTRFESDLERLFKEAGIAVVKPRQTGRYDIGDLHIEHDIVIQAKAWRDITSALREGTAGAQAQAGHAKRAIGVTAIKKPRGAIADAYIAMPLSTFITLLRSRQSP